MRVTSVLVDCPNISFTGALSASYDFDNWTANWYSWPSAAVTVTVSPGFRSFSPQKGISFPPQSTWPAITAFPLSPGLGPSLYHATCVGFFGTSIAPSGVSPTYSKPVSTPIAGIRILVGRATGGLAG